jgi:hypothetical protein
VAIFGLQLASNLTAKEESFQLGIAMQSDLSGFDPQGRSLEKAHFNSKTLDGAKLRIADLRSAKLEDANIWTADFRGAKVNDETCWPISFWQQKVQRAGLVPMESHTPTRVVPASLGHPCEPREHLQAGGAVTEAERTRGS